MTNEPQQSRFVRYAPHLIGPLAMFGMLAAFKLGQRQGWGLNTFFIVISCWAAVTAAGYAWQALRLYKEIKRKRHASDLQSVNGNRQ